LEKDEEDKDDEKDKKNDGDRRLYYCWTEYYCPNIGCKPTNSVAIIRVADEATEAGDEEVTVGLGSKYEITTSILYTIRPGPCFFICGL